MKDEFDLLTRVIALAQTALKDPATVPVLMLREIAAEVNQIDESNLIGDEIAMLLQCLVNAARHLAMTEGQGRAIPEYHAARAVRWRVVAAAIMPMAQADWSRALSMRGDKLGAVAPAAR